MKPGEHPDFFRLPPPPGASRESSIRLDASGNFWHDGERIDHPGLASAMHRWIARHPDDGRYILTNGYDWTYLQVDDAPYTVRSLRIEEGERVVLELSDGTQEPLVPGLLRLGGAEAIYTLVKKSEFPARFSRHAQTALAPLLAEGEDGEPELSIAGRRYRIPDSVSEDL